MTVKQREQHVALDAHADCFVDCPSRCSSPHRSGTRLKDQRRRVMLEKCICKWAGSPRAVAESLVSCLGEGHVSRDHHQQLHRVPAYRQEISLIVTGFVRRRSSKAETQGQNTAQSIEWSRANDMVTEMDDDGDDKQDDEDSTFIETSYTVGLNPTDSSVISTCDCPDFVGHMFPCKHMWLAAPIPNSTAEHEDRIQLYRRLAEEAGRVHAKLLRTLGRYEEYGETGASRGFEDEFVM
ncbi:BQ5605_C036g11497 [Microbotryum silenes-dioicae]|uniref:BQ5605_C036g11497 protein n=1 Tax=Microbotryum silenes-dioicae TaxID=796604 RepID=A0A2X0N230_9BASI|nr:BQ5605_C036g11497 [Microbotryum silenes-dioicae]